MAPLTESEIHDLVIAHREAKTMAVYCEVTYCGDGLGWSVRGHNRTDNRSWHIDGPFEFKTEAIRAALAIGMAIRDTPY